MSNGLPEALIAEIQKAGIDDARVLAAMREVDRSLFVEESDLSRAYGNHPLSIGHEQTISQPFVVAFLAQALELPREGARVLEIGAGSGYQAAVLSRMAAQVFTIEIIPALAERARSNLERAGIDNVIVREGDGYDGWQEESPFDGIILTAAPEKIPDPLKDQIAEGGRLVAPVGLHHQEVVVLHREDNRLREKSVLPVRFVPMTGRALGRK